jgi:hypothetical protein
MYSYSVIQAHTLLVLLLASLFAIVCSYAWTAWTTECRVLVALAKPSKPRSGESTRCLSILLPSSQGGGRGQDKGRSISCRGVPGFNNRVLGGHRALFGNRRFPAWRAIVHTGAAF